MDTDDGIDAGAPAPPGGRSRLTSWQLFSRMAGVVTFLSVVVGMGAVVHEFGIERPKDRALREAQLRASIANLVVGANVEVVGGPIQKIMNLLQDENLDMTGISVPGVAFRMAAFENVDWSGADMTLSKFVCSDRVYDLLGPTSPDDGPVEPCARLRNTNFASATLDYAVFDSADLRDSDFRRAYLRVAEIRGSVATGAKFSRSVLSGIQISDSDFTGVEFGTARDFECYENDGHDCAKLDGVVFRGARMRLARFFGTQMSQVDFAEADLHGAGFRCHDPRDERTCGYISGACFANANLENADFNDVDIAEADFTGATTTGAQFRNVRFSAVVFPPELSAAAVFDDASAASLEEARQSRLGRTEDDRPCAVAWRRRLDAWRNRFDFGQFGMQPPRGRGPRSPVTTD